jgi:hypothetical protein
MLDKFECVVDSEGNKIYYDKKTKDEKFRVDAFGRLIVKGEVIDEDF